MPKFEAKKGDFAKIWQKLGGYSPPAPRLRRLRRRGEILKTFEIFRLPPGSTVILLSEGGKWMPTNCGVDVKLASKLDFCAEVLVAHPRLRHP